MSTSFSPPVEPASTSGTTRRLFGSIIGSSRALVEDTLVRVREIELRVAAEADDVQLASGHAEVVRLSTGDPDIVRLDPPQPRVEGGHGPR